jgi:hypothetical protein
MSRSLITVLALLCIAAMLTACSEKAETTQAGAETASAEKWNLPPDHPVISTMGEGARAKMGKVSETAGSEAPLGHGGMGDARPVENAQKTRGKVLEVLNAGSFTYARVQAGAGEEWIAVNQTNLAVGAEVTFTPRMKATDFRSDRLNRTFKELTFAELEGAPASASMPGMGGMGDAMGSMHGAMSAPDAGPISVARAPGSSGRTVAELYAQKNQIRNSTVAVRGKVVKFSPGIMGRNWIHLQDGTGSAGKGDHDLTVTTTETVAVGDVVLVTGVLRADHDMGQGMRYPVVVEQAKISK